MLSLDLNLNLLHIITIIIIIIINIIIVIIVIMRLWRVPRGTPYDGLFGGVISKKGYPSPPPPPGWRVHYKIYITTHTIHL